MYRLGGLCTVAILTAKAGATELNLLIIDEETIDNGISTIEQAAYDCGVSPEMLVNDDYPTIYGNPPLYWNEFCPGGEYWLPTGQCEDEGMFAPGPDTGLDLQMFIDGMIGQEYLDEIPDVIPLGNYDIMQLVGEDFVAVVYDSDVSINREYQYGEPIYYANLQGERYGLFFFTVLDVRGPGYLPESTSSDSSYEILVQVDPVPAMYTWQLFEATGGGGPCCPADVTGDHTVDVLDLLAVLAAWGNTFGLEDINGDGYVDVMDLLELLAAWGPCG
jgi:hypothetical protein